ncbi:hypothetical protein QE381_000418 [Microbacterium sp. SORGH_AS 888]|nr:hypothetical protein [Microbacterium sp. SORGH_AS_0888]
MSAWNAIVQPLQRPWNALVGVVVRWWRHG